MRGRTQQASAARNRSPPPDARKPGPEYEYLSTGYPGVLVRRLRDDRARMEAQGRPLHDPGTPRTKGVMTRPEEAMPLGEGGETPQTRPVTRGHMGPQGRRGGGTEPNIAAQGRRLHETGTPRTQGPMTRLE